MTEKHEYSSPITLDGIAGNYFMIPESIILGTKMKDAKMNEKRLTTFSYLSIRRGLDYGLYFSINDMVKWLGKQPNRHTSGINNKILQNINHFKSKGYITFTNKAIKPTYCIEAVLNLSKISQECNNDKFAIIYLDELERIIQYKDLNPKDVLINNEILLLVFAYLRMRIYRRRNKLSPEEINIDNKNNLQHDINKRRLHSPEAYNSFYKDIANELGIKSPRKVSKAVNILNELGLIYSEPLPRMRYGDKWKTGGTLFCNTYKREGSSLLATGKEYYLAEIENKIKKLEKMFGKMKYWDKREEVPI